MLLKLKYDKLLSNFAFKCNLRRYMMATVDTAESEITSGPVSLEVDPPADRFTSVAIDFTVDPPVMYLGGAVQVHPRLTPG